jgi:hypothetical protein
MASEDWVPLVRCRLGGPDSGATSALRYVPLGEFGLWRSLMATRHRRPADVEAVSLWVSEEGARCSGGLEAEALEPVVRLELDLAGPLGVSVPVVRFFPAETYPRAREALLRHYAGPSAPRRVIATPGYFVPPSAARQGAAGDVRGAA